MRKSALLLTLGLCTAVQAQQTNTFTSPSGMWHVADTYPQGSQEFPSFLATTTTVYFSGGLVGKKSQMSQPSHVRATPVETRCIASHLPDSQPR
jgi:hypothetical protein